MIRAPLSVLVTGSSGFIGSYLVRHLRAAGHLVTGIDIRPPDSQLPDGVTFHLCDIRTDQFPARRFDAVVHLAALAGGRQSIHLADSYRRTNVDGTVRLLDFCRGAGIPHFLFASSSSVYGPETPLPACEDGPTEPCSPFALTKLQGEQWGRLHARLYGLRFVALRFFSVWGPGQRPDLALECFRRRIEVGLPVVINGDGSQRRDLTHVSDVARAVELALQWRGGKSVVLNVGTGRNPTVMEMLEVARKPATPLVEHRAPHPADVPETLASITAIGAELGWQPRISFPDGPDS
ncbi:MAG: NAD-dependent epimerase/dehydratase family protein [Akkermansiaceae bacterium]|nr:NAD-dependent epimerase/dehydratase family protein [Akkermansiaceae bacterium]